MDADETSGFGELGSVAVQGRDVDGRDLDLAVFVGGLELGFLVLSAAVGGVVSRGGHVSLCGVDVKWWRWFSRGDRLFGFKTLGRFACVFCPASCFRLPPKVVIGSLFRRVDVHSRDGCYALLVVSLSSWGIQVDDGCGWRVGWWLSV